MVEADAEGNVTPPAAPEKEGYTFVGWVDADGNLIKLNENGNLVGVTADMTITAKYEINKYKVTFVADGKVVAEIEKEYNSVLTDEDYPEVPAKEGYTGAWEKNPFAITGDITMEAKYTANPGGSSNVQKPSGTNGNSHVKGIGARTGDAAAPVLWIVVIAAAVAAVVVVVWRRKRIGNRSFR